MSTLLRIKPQKLSGLTSEMFTYVEKTKGIAFRNASLYDVIQDVVAWMFRNKVEVPENIARIIEHQIAERLPPEWVYDPDNPKKAPPVDYAKVAVNQQQVEYTTSKLRKVFSALGNKTVAGKHAVERAAICATCPNNRPVGCLHCEGIRDGLEREIGKVLHTPYDRVMHSCSVDKVFLKVKIWLPEAVFRKLIPAFARPNVAHYPESCWYRKLFEVKPEPISAPLATEANAPLSEANPAASVAPADTQPQGEAATLTESSPSSEQEQAAKPKPKRQRKVKKAANVAVENDNA